MASTMTGMEKYQHMYTSQTLIANWWEERHDSANKLDADRRLLRTGRVGETPIKMERRVETPYTSITTSTYTAPRAPRPDSSASMADSSALIYNQTSVPNAADYSNPAPTHDQNRDHRELYTTMHSSYGGAYASDQQKREKLPPPGQRTRKGGLGESEGTGSKMSEAPAGAKTHQLGKEGGGVKIFGATGEVMKVGPQFDPKEHTFIQRSWDYNQDSKKHTQSAKALSNGGGPNIEGRQLRGLGVSNDAVPQLRGRQTFARKNDTIKQDLGIWRSD